MAAALPADVRELLAAAFTGEVAERLPELEASMRCAVATGDVEATRLALRHAHTLASGAVVVGEGELALVARRCEERLLRALEPAVPDARELAGAAEDVATMVELLAPWVAKGVA